MKITPRQHEEIQKMAKKHHLRFLILHGSFAKGITHGGSDLDIAYLGEHHEDEGLDTYLKFFSDLEKIFGNSRSRELDVKSLRKADSLFRFYVVRDGQLLYGDQHDYNEFRAYVFKDYTDSYDLRNTQEILLEKSIKILSKKYAR